VRSKRTKKTSSGDSKKGSGSNSTPTQSKSEFVHRPFYEISRRPGDKPLVAKVIPVDQRQVRGAQLRRSTRWLDTFPAVSGEYQLPHIDRLGRFTGESVYTLACNPADVLSTTVSTIYGRLKRYAAAHNQGSVLRKWTRVLLRASAYYALSKNSYYMDRILFFLRNLEKNGKLIHPITLKFLTKCNADKRFVYSQVCYQTNWLIFRACKPRDKLHFKHKKSLGTPPGFLDLQGTARHGRFRSNITALAESVMLLGRTKG
jgi:hypothetical protein